MSEISMPSIASVCVTNELSWVYGFTTLQKRPERLERRVRHFRINIIRSLFFSFFHNPSWSLNVRELVIVAQLSNDSLTLQDMISYSGLPMQQGSHSWAHRQREQILGSPLTQTPQVPSNVPNYAPLRTSIMRKYDRFEAPSLPFRTLVVQKVSRIYVEISTTFRQPYRPDQCDYVPTLSWRPALGPGIVHSLLILAITGDIHVWSSIPRYPRGDSW